MSTNQTSNPIPKYRKEQNHLFAYDAQQRAYVHVYQNPACKTLSQLIKAYESDDSSLDD
jgi:hypothetical protein